MNWYLKVLKQYADFKGRARRKEYWYFILFNGIFALIAMGLDNLLGITFSSYNRNLFYGYLYVLYGLIVFIPSLAVVVRRLHDVGKSGWWYLIVLIPVIGAFIILYYMIKDSEPGTNKWGENPKGVGATITENE